MTKESQREEVIEKYRRYFRGKIEMPEFREKVRALKGKTLGCYCKPLACHGDIIAEWLEGSSEDERIQGDDNRGKQRGSAA